MSYYTWPPTLAACKALVFRANTADATNDLLFLQYIEAAQQVVENVVGPVTSTSVTEWHSGAAAGSRAVIVLRQQPVITVDTVTSWIGTTPYVFTQAADPSAATSFSYTYEAETGALTCRTSGGIVASWPVGVENISVAYHAGRVTVPANLHMACIEVARNMWDATQQGGRPSYSGDAEALPSYVADYAITPRVRELLQPHERLPGIA